MPQVRSEPTTTVGLETVIEPGAVMERMATGFEFVEGPAWNPAMECLVFSDIIGNTIYRWDRHRGVGVYRRPSHLANGTAWDHEGRLLVCEHASSRVSRVGPGQEYEVLVSHYRAQELNSPNDIIVRSDGSIWFTDPNSGRGARYGLERDQELDFQGVYRFDPDCWELELLVDDFAKPNGLCFSRDEARLFVNDTDRQHIRQFDVAADGSISGGRIWAETAGDAPGVADGMKMDSAGNLYCCGSGGIHVFDQAGGRIGIIPTPEFAANFTWGGADLRDLFITASHSLYRLRMRQAGQCFPLGQSPTPGGGR